MLSSYSNFWSVNFQFSRTQTQWRRQLWGTGARAPPPTSNSFIFSSLWRKSDSQLSKYCVVREISWCRRQQLTALSISTALVTKLLVIEQLLHPAWSLPRVPHDIISIFAPPRNKSWRCHCTDKDTEWHINMKTRWWIEYLLHTAGALHYVKII